MILVWKLPDITPVNLLLLREEGIVLVRVQNQQCQTADIKRFTQGQLWNAPKTFSFGLKLFHISNQYQGNHIKLHQFVTNWRETNLVPIFFSAISKARVFISMGSRMFAECKSSSEKTQIESLKQLLPSATFGDPLFLGNVMKTWVIYYISHSSPAKDQSVCINNCVWLATIDWLFKCSQIPTRLCWKTSGSLKKRTFWWRSLDFLVFTASVRYLGDRLLNDFDLYIFCKFPFDMYQSIFVVNAWWDYFENFLPCLLLYLCTSNFFEGGSKYIGYLKRRFDIMQDIFPNKGPLNSIIYSTTDHTTEHISCYLYQ